MTIRSIASDSPYVCGWESDACCDDLVNALASQDPQTAALAQRAVDVAAEVLYGLSGRQFGLCELTVRPCRPNCCDPCDMRGPRWTPVLAGGQWTNVSCGTCQTSCSCSSVCELSLPGPVFEVTRIRQDGVELGEHLWRIDNRGQLVRLPGSTRVVRQDALVTDNGNIVWNWSGSPSQDATVDPSGRGIRLTAGGAYNVPLIQPFLPVSQVAMMRHDVAIDVRIPAGSQLGTNTFTVGQPSCTKTVEVISGGGTADIDGTVVHYSGPTLANQDQIIRIRTTGCPTGFQQIGISPGEDDIFVDAIQYSDLTDVSTSVQCWPTCQDMTASPDEPNTFEVTYLRGRPVPSGGQGALAELACELFKSCVDPECCNLPARTKSVNRQGVSYDLLDPMEFIAEGRTGLYLVDLWLRTVNPKSRVRSAGVYSPDMPGVRRTTQGTR